MTIDATVAGASANAYLTLVEAAAYAADDLGRDAAAWLSATEDQRENALIQATIDIDEHGRLVTEVPYSELQALRYPRDVDVASGSPYLPTRLKRATWEQAKYLLHTADLRVDARARRARGLASFSDDDGSGTMSLHPELERLSDRARAFLEGILRPVVGSRPTIRSVRMASGLGAYPPEASA